MQGQLDGVQADLQRVDEATARAAAALDSADPAAPGVRTLLGSMDERITSAGTTSVVALAVIAACLIWIVVLLFPRCAGPGSARDATPGAEKAHPWPLQLRILQSAATALVVAGVVWLILYLIRHPPWAV